MASRDVQAGILAREKADLEVYEVTPDKVQRVFASIAFNEKAKPKDRIAAAQELAKIMGMYTPKQVKRPVVFHLNFGGEASESRAQPV